MPPPPGVVPDFVHPVSRAHQVIVVTVVFLTLAALMVMLRMYTRWFITRAVGYDDCE